MLDPTPRQQQILAFIRGTIHGKGRSPTQTEIALKFGMRSQSSGPVAHLAALEKKGLIARGIAIRLVDVDPVLAFGGTIG